nr:MAG TPA: hypothetical protein [Caudoviricetes sp.]
MKVAYKIIQLIYPLLSIKKEAQIQAIALLIYMTVKRLPLYKLSLLVAAERM